MMDGVNLWEVLATSGITQMGKMAVSGFVSYLKTLEYGFSGEENEEILQEYLEQCYEYNATMNTIVFRGEKKTIFDLYVPLTLVQSGEEKEEIIVDKSIIDSFKNINKIMIVDNAGMGKSTIVKYISVQSVLQNGYIPIVIELRKLSKEKGLWEYILKQFELMDRRIEEDDMRSLLSGGGFLIFLDGYDEIQEDYRTEIIEEIKDITLKANRNIYVLTSRDEDGLASFGDFSEYKIKPLSIEEAFSLIKKYGANGERASRLIEVIKEDRKNFSVISEFLGNPLLVSLLYKTFEYKEELPYKKTEFYRQVYEALFNDHDKTKDAYSRPKKCGLEIREFESVLRYLGFASMKSWRVEYETIQELMEAVNLAIKAALGREDINVDYYINDLTHTVPVFQKVGNEYKWVHKSFMEYFAAQCIYLDVEGERKEELLKMMAEPEKRAKYYNVLDFYFDIDPKAMRKYIVKPYLEEYKSVYNMRKQEFKDAGYSMTKALLDYIVSAEFMFNYRIVNMAYGEPINEPFKGEYDRGAIRIRKIPEIRWQYYGNANGFLARLLSEKNIDISRKLDTIVFSEDDNEKMLEIMDGVKVVDNAMFFLEKNIDKKLLKKILGMLFRMRRRQYCIDIEKCNKLISRIEEEIERDNKMNEENFWCLE